MTPMNPKDYPADWARISLEVRARSKGQCECRGECGRKHVGRCEAINGIHGARHRETDRWRSTEELIGGVERFGENDSDYAGGSMVVLTVAHLHKGPCAPCAAKGVKCGNRDHLGAFCQACHLSYDIEQHTARRKQNRFAKKAVGDLFARGRAMWVNVRQCWPMLVEHHYLGPIRVGIGWLDELGCIVISKPTSRRLPQDGTWMELRRWCIVGGKNAGSTQWARVRRELHRTIPALTTVVSYSDPSAGHTGALYKASGWVWRPPWHRLRPPPTGNGKWSTKVESVKDRWACFVRSDPRRDNLLSIKDAAVVRALQASA